LRVPNFDPFRYARQRGIEVVYRPLRLAYGYFMRLADSSPLIVLSSTIADPRDLKVTLTHEEGHEATSLSGAPGLQLGTRRTVGRLQPSVWAVDKGPLSDGPTDMTDDSMPAIRFACTESALTVPSKAEAAADRWAMDRLMPLDWTVETITRHVENGGQVDDAFIADAAESLGLKHELVRRCLAARAALEQLPFGSNDGIWPRGDAP